MRFWIIFSISLLGVIALSLLVWFLGPLIGSASIRPFEPWWSRLIILAIIWLIFIIRYIFLFLKRARERKKLEEALKQEEQETSDAPILRDKMKDALVTLKKSSKAKGNYLYELPWYIMIGPPGSGKTTALVNSGLKFPLAGSDGPQAVSGIGGTRYCDWWFTEDAVLVDTAGRYTTQDSDAESDKKSWSSFLDLLAESRPKQPINGVMIAISLQDLLTLSPDELNAHADAIRKRLIDLHTHLKVDFPVYAMFTKADLVAGFMEYFGTFSESRRRVVWGATFQTEDRSKNMVGAVPGELDALIERLHDEMPDRLQEEPDPKSRVLMYGLPMQMAAMKRKIVDFLNQVFEPTRYHANAMLRGFYFTSGTQEGTPIDQVIGALVKDFNASDIGSSAYSGRGKSFFLNHLLTKVIFEESGWVSTNKAAVRRATILQIAGYSAIALACIILSTLWTISYLQNSDLVEQSQIAMIEYREIGAQKIEEPTVSDTDFFSVLDMLHKLRQLPTGYAVREEPTPTSQTYGLSQRDRLQTVAEDTYSVALERVFRPRLILRVERQIQKNINDQAYLFDALKVYKMLGGRAPSDDLFLLDWFGRDWEENVYPGAGSASGRVDLEDHLIAMLELDLGKTPLVELNYPLVEQAERVLARMSVAERAYTLMKSLARTSAYPDWVPLQRGGPDTALVFEAGDGADFDTIRVPAFYTYAGFHRLFLEIIGGIAEAVEEESWVLGEAGEQEAVKAQYDTLQPDVLALYEKDFIDAWNTQLARLRLRPLSADKPQYIALSAASSATSPIRQIIESVKDETKLTVEREIADPEASGNSQSGMRRAARRQALRAGSKIARRFGGQVGAAAFKIGRRARAGGGGGGGAQGLITPGANIEAYFKPFHVLADGDAGRRPVDTLIANLDKIYENLQLAAINPAQAQVATGNLQVQVASLRANVSRLPNPIDDMMRQAASDFEGDAAGTTITQLNQQLADNVTRVCEQLVPNRYPFSQGSSRDLPIQDFSRLFAPNGVIDRFFSQNLASLADLSGKDWTWRDDTRLGRELSNDTLKQFQRAAEIRDAFFPTGGTVPSVDLQITPLTLSASAVQAAMEINGNVVISQQGLSRATNLQWPGPGGRSRAAIAIFPEVPGRTNSFGKDGAWALFRLLQAGRVSRSGDVLSARFVIGGREVSYKIAVGSLLNPFTLNALRTFQCPKGL